MFRVIVNVDSIDEIADSFVLPHYCALDTANIFVFFCRICPQFYVKICSSYRTVSSGIWQIFYEFLIFPDLFYKNLDESNNRKIWRTSKIFVNIARGYCGIISLSFGHKKICKKFDANKKYISKNRSFSNMLQLPQKSTF